MCNLIAFPPPSGPAYYIILKSNYAVKVKCQRYCLASDGTDANDSLPCVLQTSLYLSRHTPTVCAHGPEYLCTRDEIFQVFFLPFLLAASRSQAE